MRDHRTKKFKFGTKSKIGQGTNKHDIGCFWLPFITLRIDPWVCNDRDFE